MKVLLGEEKIVNMTSNFLLIFSKQEWAYILFFYLSGKRMRRPKPSKNSLYEALLAFS